MQEPRVARFSFERVAEGVAEIQNAAQAAFALVGGNHLHLHAHGVGDDAVHGIGLARQHIRAAFGQKSEQLGVPYDPGLENFEQPGAILAFGQGLQRRRVNGHIERLVEAAHQVLTGHQVDAGLAADGRVHLRQQRGGDLNHRDAAHEDGRQEARHVGDDAAAKGNHQAGAVAAAAHHFFGRLFERPEALPVLAAGQENQLVFFSRKAARQGRALMPPHVFGRDHEEFATLCRKALGQTSDSPAFHRHGIATVRSFDAKGRHTEVVPRAGSAGVEAI